MSHKTRAAASRPISDAPGWTFFRQWLKNPLGVAAISPSSPQLARQMMSELPRGAKRVIELGGGTGVFTQALLDHGIAPADLLVLELNEELHQHLQKHFPTVQVACADARDLAEVAAARGFGPEAPADAVISGLGLLSMPKATQQAILSGRRQCGELVEKQRPPVGVLEPPVAGLRSTREAARLVTEELGLDQLLGQCRAIHGDERPRPSRRQVMQALGNQFLAGPAFANHEHGTVKRRCAARPLDRVEESKALADKLIGPFHVPTCGDKSHHMARYFG